MEAVIRVVVVALADLSQEDRPAAGLHREVVIQPLLDVDALARGEPDLGSCRNRVSVPIGVDSDVGVVVDFLIRQGIVHPDQHVPAAPVDDVLRLVPVEVVGGVLAFLQVKELFRVHLGVLVRQGAVPVADGDEGEAKVVEVPLAVISNVPAQHTLPHLIVLVPLGLPFLRGEVAERGQGETVLGAHGFQFLQSLIDFRTLHVLPFLSYSWWAFLRLRGGWPPVQIQPRGAERDASKLRLLIGFGRRILTDANQPGCQREGVRQVNGQNDQRDAFLLDLLQELPDMNAHFHIRPLKRLYTENYLWILQQDTLVYQVVFLLGQKLARR